ncbi:MAG: VOC family protein [Streptosporangiales bacterium]|nr:VOC family protein [Streptosporangiales bacterium]
MSTTRPHGLCPHIFVRDADAAVAFYARAFEAHEIFRTALADGHVLFVELGLGDGRLLVSAETPGFGAHSAESVGGSPVLLTLFVDDPDEVARRAIDVGAAVEIPVQDMFWGERYGVLRDPFGHRWAVTTERGDLSPDEMAARSVHVEIPDA